MSEISQHSTEGRVFHWTRRFIQLLLIVLTLALMAAILLPVFRGVSDDPRPRDAMGLPIGDRPHRPPPRK